MSRPSEPPEEEESPPARPGGALAVSTLCVVLAPARAMFSSSGKANTRDRGLLECAGDPRVECNGKAVSKESLLPSDDLDCAEARLDRPGACEW